MKFTGIEMRSRRVDEKMVKTNTSCLLGERMLRLRGSGSCASYDGVGSCCLLDMGYLEFFSISIMV